jgi:hypothetical protein
MDKLKKGFAWFLPAFFGLMFKTFATGSSHRYWFPAFIASFGLFASFSWIRRLKHPRDFK